MIIAGLTGGIGSGKTTVAGFFKEHGIPLYIADDAGKRLMRDSSKIREQIVSLLGQEAYSANEPDRKFIASRVFSDRELLSKLNNIIHPAVAEDFRSWTKNQTSAYVIYEAAILFETGGYKKCDLNILVTAPMELRMERLQKRDDSSIEEIQQRMSNQWSDEKKSELADFIINNVDLNTTKQQVAVIHAKILKTGKNS
ncbi:dephospho-CoA kinase [Christiangramia sabulilitoris]|uniref:Dephospho-CoA kinase n=1 Tax=Christiangramia sabulilitoris TaxID=2583991 RepID=A0A550I7Q5_9FLAO|nr:dephospho-CoA kinase [Christiangramia sabulilitoris]TRO66997.1 dephospho-CoA kinase [Christiangramia sabulilitoris]